MSLDPEIREQTYQYFLQEAPELLNDLEQGLLSFRTDRGINQVNNLMRVTHTLKGAATSVGLETIATIAHSLEDIFKALCQPNLVLQPDAEALLFEGVECLRLPLIAELTGGVVNHTEILDRAATVFAQLQEQLGDCFDQVAQLPTSAELGFDVILSIFELGVEQRLEQISLALEHAQPEAIATTLQTQAEVFLGLAESLNLPGFGAIAALVLTALTQHPDQAQTIAEVALADFRAGQAAVFAGDRTQGGQASERLQHLAKVDLRDGHRVTPVTPVIPTPVIPITPVATLTVNSSEEQPIHSLLDHIWGGQAIDPELDPSVLGTSVLDTSSLEIPNLETTDLDATNLDATNLDVTNLDVTNLDVMNLDATDLDILNLEITDLDIPVDTEDVEAFSGKSASITCTDLSPVRIQDAQDPIYSVSPSPIPPPSSSPPRDPVAPAPQIRVHVQYLDQLNNAIGELITQQNRQFLQTEQLQSTVKTLFTRLRQHQQLLYQVSQQSKRSQRWSEKQHSRAARKKAKSVGKSVPKTTSNPVVPHSVSAHSLPANSASSDFSTQLQTLLDDMVQLMEAADAIELFSNQANQTIEQQQHLLSTARNALIEARMMPVGKIFNRLPAVLQQLGNLYHKPVELVLQGAEVLVDKVIAEKLYDPLLHLVRNAFDHGIESEASRHQQGKPAKGTIEISACNQGRYLTIAVQDDGKGLAFDQIRQRAVERQLIPLEQASTLTEAQLIDLLFTPGFSTAVQINDISGRGIGLDVVKNQIQALQGTITVQTQPMQGTRFLLRIPLNLTIAPLLIAEAENKLYALLDDAIEQILLPQADQVKERNNCRVLQWEEDDQKIWIPVHSLSKSLQYHSIARPAPTHIPPSNQPAIKPIILIRHQGSLFGLEVDQLIGEQELIIRPLSPLLTPPSYIHGACIVADGRSALVMDVALLMQQTLNLATSTPSTTVTQVNRWSEVTSPALPSVAIQPKLLPQLLPAHSTPSSSTPSRLTTPATAQPQILVVDDSITTRQNLTLVLQKAGYQVVQAENGFEAITQLNYHHQIQLVVCDLEMPVMNGFEFLRHLQQPPRLNIPVLMLTSRSDEKFVSLALQLGAAAYMTKPYIEHRLLNAIADLVAQKV